MNQAQQLVQCGRQIDSILRRLDVTFKEWTDLMNANIEVGKIPDVETLGVLCENEDRPALKSAIADDRVRVAREARAKADEAIAAAENAAGRVEE